MGVAMVVLLVGVVFGVAGFEFHLFWVVADMLVTAWLVGFFAPAHKHAVWYRW